jgi:hypothetical protein
MKIDPGLAIVVGAVLIFYLRLIILQRERARRVREAAIAATQKKGKKAAPPTPPRYSIVSEGRIDRTIGVIGIVLILLGLLFYSALILPETWQTYWWIPTSLGIVAFSWLFRL